jgi:penicillin amidase
MRRLLLKTGLFLMLTFVGFFLFFLGYFLMSRPRYEGKTSLRGLGEQVRIITDRWGVPHIHAANEKDLFFACGYVHAKERMWQMELMRRAGQGRLSEIFGEDQLERDKYMRVMGLREASRRDLEKLSPDMRDILISYSQGINAWMATRKNVWPPEFFLLRYRPEPWTPVDSLAIKQVMCLLLCTDFPSEVIRGNLIYRVGQEKALQVLEEGIEAPSFEPEKIRLSGLMDLVYPGQSNGWVLSGSRTASGRPLLANDPHLEISLPPVWYEVHLNCPTINVTGVSIPGLPAVIIGHNESIAWGLTNSTVDVQDLYLEKFDDDQNMYWDRNEWKPLVKREEVFRIRGKKEPERIDVLWTSRGPVISPLVVESPQPVSLRWIVHEGGRAMEACYLLHKAADWESFTEALRLFDAPSQIFIYADKNGSIGLYLGGRIPLRAKEAALFPFPSWREGGEWTGYVDEGQKPNLYNPQEEMIVAANQKTVPGDYSFYLGVDWDAPFRAERIRERLLEEERHSVESFQALQADVYSKKAELVFPYLERIEGTGGKLEQALGILRDWDLRMNSGSAPALYSAFMNYLPEQIFLDELGEDFRSFDFFFRRKEAGLLRILSDSDSPWFDDKGTAKIENREEIMQGALLKAYNHLEWKRGSSDQWDWAKMNAVRYKHVLGRSPFFRFFNLGSIPAGGGAFTVKVNFLTPQKTSWSTSCRQIMDLSDWDRSLSVISSGQSGHFMSRFYDDQRHIWANGAYHPQLFSPQVIEKNAVHVLILKPKKNLDRSPDDE